MAQNIWLNDEQQYQWNDKESDRVREGATETDTEWEHVHCTMYMINRKYHINYCLSPFLLMRSDQQTRANAQRLQLELHPWFDSITEILMHTLETKIVTHISIFPPCFFLLFQHSPHTYASDNRTHTQACTRNFTFFPLKNSFGVTVHKSQKCERYYKFFFLFLFVTVNYAFFVENKEEWKKQQ